MSIADKLTYLNTTKQLLKTEINKINNVLDDNSTFRSYPRELFNGYLDILNNGTNTLWNNLEKVSQTGTEAVLEGVETAPMKMVLNGNTSQDGTPTPDTPVEVKVVTGENVVSVSGKNLMDNKAISGVQNGVAYTINQDKSITLNGTSTQAFIFDIDNGRTLEAGTYTLSLKGKILGCGIYLYENNTLKAYVSSNWTNDKNTFTLDKKTTFKEIRIDVQVNKTFNNITIYPMIEKGSTATTYEEYKGASYPINLGNIELCKIGDYQDYLFKRNGKWYLEKKIGKVVLDGSETGWHTSSLSVTGYKNYYVDSSVRIYPYVSGNKCNYFEFKTYDEWIGLLEATFIEVTTQTIGIRVLETLAPTLEDFKTWLSTHNTIVYYVLATPTEEEITNTTLIEQLEAISKAKSVKDKTYITQTNDELPFILDVEAIKEYEVN